jgi:uncharacterized protein YeaC (DUF1315 family)
LGDLLEKIQRQNCCFAVAIWATVCTAPSTHTAVQTEAHIATAKQQF